MIKHLEPPRLVAIVCALVFGGATVARSAEIPTQDFWGGGGAPMWVLIGTGVVAGVAGVISAARLRRQSRDATLSEACVQLAAYVNEQCPRIDLGDVGVHVWVVGGPFFARQLRRGQDFVLRKRQPSHVTFTKGKGLIGRAWQERHEQIRNFGRAPYRNVNRRGDFGRLSEEDRLGLSWDEYRRTRRYKAIWAVPLFRDHEFANRVVGVASVDLQKPGRFQELEAALSSNPRPELSGILWACETALGRSI